MQLNKALYGTDMNYKHHQSIQGNFGSYYNPNEDKWYEGSFGDLNTGLGADTWKSFQQLEGEWNADRPNGGTGTPGTMGWNITREPEWSYAGKQERYAQATATEAKSKADEAAYSRASYGEGGWQRSNDPAVARHAAKLSSRSGPEGNGGSSGGRRSGGEGN